jgi:dTDP-glucose 4,6-dehydratase
MFYEFLAINNKIIPIYGNGKNIRDWIYVKDNCNAIIGVLKHGIAGEVYNIGGSNEKKNIEIVDEILSHLGLGQDYISYVEDRLGHDFRYSLDNSKIIDLIGTYNLTEFSSALRTTINWYIDNSKTTQSSYVSK